MEENVGYMLTVLVSNNIHVAPVSIQKTSNLGQTLKKAGTGWG